MSQAVNPATNHIVGMNYDGNGNQTSSSMGTLLYDAENRLLGFANYGTQYAYDSQNKRIWKGTLSSGVMTQEIYFYGVNGQRLGTYPLSASVDQTMIMTDGGNGIALAVYFGGKRVGTSVNGGAVTRFNPDRLGSGSSVYPLRRSAWDAAAGYSRVRDVHA